MPTEQIEPEQIERIRAAAQKALSGHRVSLAYLFGSMASGRETPLSDIDIAVLTEQDFSPHERLRLELKLEIELAELCDGEFDVRIINDAPLAVRGTVVQTGLLLYVRNDADRVEFETNVRSRYFDFLPFLRRYDNIWLDAQRKDLQARGLL